ncbi:MAG: cytochrome c oxidase subunit II [Proteobacteria bacterium]|nr:cytochrome c oxidase subunit II [Pseudomonadota bacterium]
MRGYLTNAFAVVASFGMAGVALAAEPQPWQIGLQPPAGSVAVMTNDFHNLLLVITGFISAFVLALLIWVCVRYRASANPIPSKTTHNPKLEVIWTVIPVLILLVISVPSFRLLYYIDRTDSTDMVVKVIGAQWYWRYEYPDDGVGFDSYIIADEDLAPGQLRLLSVDNPLVVPEATRIKLLVEGNDVLHSFFVPSLAVQIYTVPGRTNERWIDVPAGRKTYYGQCNQICGEGHAYMPIVIQALPQAEYDRWLDGAKEEFSLVRSPQVPPQSTLAESPPTAVPESESPSIVLSARQP